MEKVECLPEELEENKVGEIDNTSEHKSEDIGGDNNNQD